MTELPRMRFSGKLLRKHREAAGMSRLDLARAISFTVTPDTIRAYEFDERQPLMDTALILAKELGKRVEDFLSAKSQ